MAGYLRVKNWYEHQHYKDGRPIHWIKLHLAILEDYEIGSLPELAQLHLYKIWMLAGKLDNKIPNDPAWVAQRIGAKSEVDLNQLIMAGFLVPYEIVRNGTDESAVALLREEKSREYKQEKDGAASPPTIWDAGVAQGLPRSLVGKWIKAHGEARTAEVIAKLAVKRPADPVQFGTALLQDRPEKLFVPMLDSELVPFAKTHNLPEPGKTDTYDEYRRRLWPLVKDLNARMSA